MNVSKRQKIIGGVCLLVLLIFITQWDQFVQGFKKGYDAKPSGHSAENVSADEHISPQISFQEYNGRIFQILKPDSWQVTETQNGIDVYDPSHPQSLCVSSAVLIGASGSSDPFQFADWLIQSMGVEVQKVIYQQNMPSVSGSNGTEWQKGTKEYIVLRNGENLHFLVSSTVCNNWGQFSATSALMMSPEKLWPEWGQTLYLMSESIQVINPGALGGMNGVNLPKNNPLDSSAIISSGEFKNRSQDRNSQGWRETTMGYKTGKSESTGRFYNMPFNHYDPTVGGYRNPDNPHELLNTEYDAEK
jgi:hypothetical protein